ncbi:MAG TPA: hypothetical protein VK602_04190, partial [Phyllobacterium sp.]|nr:hypothetical protein [Phyllobacterium sp.]
KTVVPDTGHAGIKHITIKSDAYRGSLTRRFNIHNCRLSNIVGTGKSYTKDSDILATDGPCDYGMTTEQLVIAAPI